MRLYVAVTDKEWFTLHASKPSVEEVNFWRPSPDAIFKALIPGEILLFKLHAPDNFIAGGGFFTRFVNLPINLVWDTFGEANGVRTLEEMRRRIAYYRRVPITPLDNPTVGCIMLADSSGRVQNGFLVHRTSNSTRFLERAIAVKPGLERPFGTRFPSD